LSSQLGTGRKRKDYDVSSDENSSKKQLAWLFRVSRQVYVDMVPTLYAKVQFLMYYMVYIFHLCLA